VSGPAGKPLLPGRAATVVYTDGACSVNPGPGGWAWAVPRGRYASGAAARTTNQRMEITASLEAVRALDGPLEVVSDSTYVIRCFRDQWWEGWLQRNWRNRQRKPSPTATCGSRSSRSCGTVPSGSAGSKATRATR
jgi:ribonuclease HI